MTASVAKSHTWDRRTPEKERPPEKRCTSRPGHKTQKRTRAVRVLSYIYTVITCTAPSPTMNERETPNGKRWSSATGGPSQLSGGPTRESTSISIVYQSDNKLLVRTLKRHRFWILCGNRQAKAKGGTGQRAPPAGCPRGSTGFVVYHWRCLLGAACRSSLVGLLFLGSSTEL